MKKVTYGKHIRVKPITKVITAIRDSKEPEKQVTWEELVGRR